MRVWWIAAFDDVYGMDLTVFESRWRSRSR
jgi:hypothetical protein